MFVCKGLEFMLVGSERERERERERAPSLLKTGMPCQTSGSLGGLLAARS